MTSTTPVQVCVDCMIQAVNGDGEHDESTPWALWNDTRDVVPGLHHEWHDDECDGEGLFECDCEHDPFSRVPCEGCGSTLAGERWMMTDLALHSDAR